MIGGNQLPFRLPCHGGAATGFFFGSPFNHRSVPPVPAFGNTTQMKDHCGNTIGAKALLYQLDVCGTDVCGGGDCNACPGGVDLVTNTPAGPKIADNTWSAATGTVQLEPTRKIGGKWAQAFKNWHGRYGFNYHPDTGADCVTGALSSTKYRTITVSLLYIHYDPDSAEEYYDEWTGSGSFSVNKNTGERTKANCAYDAFNNDFGTITRPPAPGDSNFGDLIDQMLGACGVPAVYQNMVNTINANGGPGTGAGQGTYSLAKTDSHYEIHATVLTFASDGGGGFYRNVQIDFTMDLSDAYTVADVYADAKTLLLNWSLLDDQKYPFRTDGHTTVAPLVIYDGLASTIDPQVDFACQVDDYENPVNNDTGDVPFSAGWVAAPKWAQRAWFDPTFYQWIFPAGDTQTTAAATALMALYTGAVMGAPLAAGYGQAVGGNPWGVYDRAHENWFRRNCIFGAGWSTGQQSRGNFTPTYLPGNAQKWTDDFHATTLWPCAFAYTDVAGVYLQKWCEIKNKRPSANFARPFGPDKFALDETRVYFMADNTAGVVTLKNGDGTTPSSLPFTVADIVGGASIGGFYHVTAVGTDTVTLGAKVYDVPAGWNTPSNDGLSCFGALRWPTAPGMDFTDTGLEIGGRVQITVTNGAPVGLTTATTQTYLSITAPENIDILDANMTLLAANVAATRVDATHFTVPTAYAAIVTAQWIIPTGTKYKFADSRSKGDYVHRTWTVRISDSTVLAATQADACLEFSPCGPSLAGFTPNGETSAGGDLYPFPASVNNGEVWLGQIQFWMIDPFWQQPHVPVVAHDSLTGTDFDPATDQIIWKMDDGTCQADYMEVGGGGENIFHKFYPLHPFVEARCTLPTINGDIPPAPAGGIDITAVAGPPGQAFIGDLDGPLINAIVVPVPDWTIMTAEQGCIDAAGQFADDYQADSDN